ncbi:hypothetical protein HYU82_02440 [Candidatus Saccharibacteria bacterium]|nr:hypothetical protein [Candidatus Saccharibacteria bacterium]MBI2285656.1 hypothetical protein [Candidatus Saccharibacteria bacterium]
MKTGKFHYPEGGDLTVLADRIAENDAAPDPEFFALYAKTTVEKRNLSREQLLHYRKMMALQLDLITNMSDETAYNPEQWEAIRALVGPELSELRGFREDLSDLTEPWRAALHEVLVFYSNPDAEERS